VNRLSAHLPDLQVTRDTRGLEIDQVGVSDLRYPITVLDRDQRKQETVATVSLSVSLPHHFKGTHMSRFIEILNRYRGAITMRTLSAILADMKRLLEAKRSHIDLRFPYFIAKSAPVTGARALMDYECAFSAESSGRRQDFVLSVAVPVKSLCPCSKQISDYGAHNQRGVVAMSVRMVADRKGMPALVWIEELVEIAERSGSAPVYPLLKRADERHVTMQAYDNPRFVEDIVRNVALQLRRDKRITWFRVRVENQESIHNHSAFAVIERDRRSKRGRRRN